MRLREIITIYLAIGAPLAAAYFLRQRAGARKARALMSSAAIAALWPVAAIMLAVAPRRALQANKRPFEESAPKREAIFWLEEKIEGARDNLLAALRRIEQLAAETRDVESEKLQRAARDARAAVERYVALALAVAETEAEAASSAPEMELHRIAGRSGDDLLLAGRCLRRRNVARLTEHRARARTEALHALAATRELARCEAGSAGSFSPRANLLAARRLAEAFLETYVRAVELFSILDDTRAVLGVARLLDAECGRLRRLAALSPRAQSARAHGGKPCDPSTLPPQTSPPLPLPPRATPAS